MVADITAAQSDRLLDFVLGSYERHLRSQGRAPNTLKIYSRWIRNLWAYLRENGMPADLEQLYPEHIEAYQAHLMSTLAPASAHQAHRSLKSFFKWAVDRREIQRDPMEGVKPPRVPDTPIAVFSLSQLRTLLNHCDRDRTFRGKRDHALLRLLCTTGMRLSEAADLAVDADSYKRRELEIVNRKESTAHHPDMPSGFVDWDAGTIVLIQTKSGRHRIGGIDDETGTVLARYLRDRFKHKRSTLPWLWLSTSGRVKNSERGRMGNYGVGQVLQRRLKEAGLPHAGVHALRHSWVALQRQTPMSDAEIGALAGWTAKSTAQLIGRYGNIQINERAVESSKRYGFAKDL